MSWQRKSTSIKGLTEFVLKTVKGSISVLGIELPAQSSITSSSPQSWMQLFCWAICLLIRMLARIATSKWEWKLTKQKSRYYHAEQSLTVTETLLKSNGLSSVEATVHSTLCGYQVSSPYFFQISATTSNSVESYESPWLPHCTELYPLNAQWT